LAADDGPSRPCLRDWLRRVPDPRSPLGRWHPLEFVLALAVCAFTAAGHDSPAAIAEWAAGCPRETLLILGGRPDPLTGHVRAPSGRTFRRVFAKIDADALNQALYGFLEAMPAAAAKELPEVTRHERELDGTDAEFADATWTEQGKGHGRREKRAIRTAPAAGIDWPGAAQILRIRRDAGPTRGPWTSKEIAYGITSLPEDLAGPRHLAIYARNHWAIENKEHHVRDVTFREDAQRARTGNQPNAHAGIRNLVMGTSRRKGHASIAAARRYYGRDDQRILALYGYTRTDINCRRSHNTGAAFRLRPAGVRNAA
jgi:hypothetical protein